MDTDKNNIILIGYRASGKSSVGKLLAKKLNKQFVDVDEMIIQRFGGISIAQIWERFGEDDFRVAEAKVAQELANLQNSVIALGGGTLMNAQSAKAIKEMKNAWRIYLYCQPQFLHKRICTDKNSAANRPSLTAHSGSLEEIKKVLQKREPVYRQVADVIIDTTDMGSAKQAAEAVSSQQLEEKMFNF